MLPPRPPHVVVLDGTPLYAEVYGSVLTSEVYRVGALTDCAIDPDDLLRMLPDLVVLDIHRGFGLAGLSSLRHLRADPDGGAVPVLASPTIAPTELKRYDAELAASARWRWPSRSTSMICSRRRARQSHRRRRRGSGRTPPSAG